MHIYFCVFFYLVSMSGYVCPFVRASAPCHTVPSLARHMSGTCRGDVAICRLNSYTCRSMSSLLVYCREEHTSILNRLKLSPSRSNLATYSYIVVQLSYSLSHLSATCRVFASDLIIRKLLPSHDDLVRYKTSSVRATYDMLRHSMLFISYKCLHIYRTTSYKLVPTRTQFLQTRTNP